MGSKPGDEWYADLIGTVLDDRYEVSGFLDKGGQAAVFEGRDLRLDRPVAIKLLTNVTATKADIEAEAKRIARIPHPGILTVFDFGSCAYGTVSLPYLVMELLPGHDLHGLRELADGQLPLAEVVPLAMGILDALAAAHEIGVHHRDLHLRNVMLDRLGNPKLVDFGLSKSADGLAPMSEVGKVAGVTHFIAPERWLRARDPRIADDPRGDLWSVGVLLFELAVGGAPWHAQGDGLAYQAINAPHARLSNALAMPHLAPLDQFLDRMLAKEPEGRPATAQDARQELRTAWRAVQSGSPTTSGLASGPLLSAEDVARELKDARREQDTDEGVTGTSTRAQGTWWVNQGFSFDQESADGKIGAGTVHWTHRTMRELEPGDLLVHAAGGSIRAFGRVSDKATEVRPGRVEASVDYTMLSTPIRIDDIPMAWREREQTTVGGPFRKDGRPHQGYLFRLGEAFVEELASRYADRWPTYEA